MTAYYNECDAFAAVWLGELMKEGLIPDGEVDERSITEVQASDLKGFTESEVEAIKESMSCFPLSRRIPARVGLLRGAGNSLCAPQAQAFIEAYLSLKR